jgi:hypothetical protein
MLPEVKPESLVDLVEEVEGFRFRGKETFELPGELPVASGKVVARRDEPVTNNHANGTGGRDGPEREHAGTALPHPEPSDNTAARGCRQERQPRPRGGHQRHVAK